jgi:hypothetical protein
VDLLLNQLHDDETPTTTVKHETRLVIRGSTGIPPENLR